MQAHTTCSNCATVIQPHAVCVNCGHYKGVKVVRTKIERGLQRDEIRKAKEQRAKGGKAATEKAAE